MADMPLPLYRLEISKSAKLVLSYLWRYASRDRFVWVDRETIVDHLGIKSERTLRRHLGELRQAGAIEEDVQVRAGRARSGWWLRDGRDVGGQLAEGRDDQADRDVDGVSDPGELQENGAGPTEREVKTNETQPTTEEIGNATSETQGPAEGGSEAGEARGQKWPAPDRNDRPRPKVAAQAAKSGHATLLELPGTNSLSRSQIPAVATSGAPPGAEVDRVRAGLAHLRRWRKHGDDPEGLGPWPCPTTPAGMQLPQLPMGEKLADLLRQDRTPEELHHAVHLVAELVEAGEMPADKWRSTYVFSGWLEQLVVQALQLRVRRAREQQRHEAQQPAPVPADSDEFSRDSMLQAMSESMTLRGVSDELQSRPPRAEPTPSQAPDDYIELLDFRSHVQASAEQLGRDPRDLVRALGRSSLRELHLDDRERLQEILAELRGGAP